MSAFFLAVNRKQTPFNQSLAKNMMRQLDRFGGDAKELLVQENFALGYQSHWSVPEEVGESQPLKNTDGSYFVFHGRVDNREALFEALTEANPDQKISQTISDAVLVDWLVTALGESAIETIVGPFVFVKFNPEANSVLLARDAMGGRYLVHRVTEQHILISTYEMALVAHDSIDYRINQEKAARYLLNEMESVPSSLIKDLSPLNPGMKLRVDGSGSKLERYYRHSPKARTIFASEECYATEFKRLLKQAVARRMRTTGAVGSMLSGGMDSVPMTILAQQCANQKAQNITAFSWVFEKYPALDERQYSSPICQTNKIEQIMLNCDDLWPKFDATTDLNPIIPFGIPFSEYQEETLRIAKSKNITTVLTGIHGDLLYEYTHGIFYELLRKGEVLLALTELRALYKASKSPREFITLHLLRPLPLVQKISAWRRRNQTFKSDVVTDEVAKQFKQAEHWLKKESRGSIRPQQWQVVLDGFAGDDAVHGRYLDAKHGVERRYPFRDRELCEFMLAIPSDQLNMNSVKRPIVKRAFAHEFSQKLLSRNDKTNFSEAIYEGIKSDKKNLKWFKSEQADWRSYVKQCYFVEENSEQSANPVVRWRCGYYDYWKCTCYNPTFEGLS